jgi:hypothetical protein
LIAPRATTPPLLASFAGGQPPTTFLRSSTDSKSDGSPTIFHAGAAWGSERAWYTAKAFETNQDGVGGRWIRHTHNLRRYRSNFARCDRRSDRKREIRVRKSPQVHPMPLRTTEVDSWAVLRSPYLHRSEGSGRRRGAQYPILHRGEGSEAELRFAPGPPPKREPRAHRVAEHSTSSPK